MWGSTESFSYGNTAPTIRSTITTSSSTNTSNGGTGNTDGYSYNAVVYSPISVQWNTNATTYTTSSITWNDTIQWSVVTEKKTALPNIKALIDKINSYKKLSTTLWK